MAFTTESSYTGDGSTTEFLITFPFLESTDIKARVNAVDTSAFSVTGTTVTFNTAPPNTQAVLLYRDTNNDKTEYTIARDGDNKSTLLSTIKTPAL